MMITEPNPYWDDDTGYDYFQEDEDRRLQAQRAAANAVIANRGKGWSLLSPEEAKLQRRAQETGSSWLLGGTEANAIRQAIINDAISNSIKGGVNNARVQRELGLPNPQMRTITDDDILSLAAAQQEREKANMYDAAKGASVDYGYTDYVADLRKSGVPEDEISRLQRGIQIRSNLEGSTDGTNKYADEMFKADNWY